MKVLALDKILWLHPGQGIAAAGRIPKEAEFFQDHFPGFPILPGVLALEMLKQTAESYVRHFHPDQKLRFILKEVRAVKFSRYLKPNDEWESRLALKESSETETRWEAQLFHGGEQAVTAKFVLAASPISKVQFLANV